MLSSLKNLVTRVTVGDLRDNDADRDLVVLCNEARTPEDVQYAARAVRLRRRA